MHRKKLFEAKVLVSIYRLLSLMTKTALVRTWSASYLTATQSDLTDYSSSLFPILSYVSRFE